MLKERLLKMLSEKREQEKKLSASIVEAETKEERAAISDTIKAIRAEIDNLEKAIEEMDKPADDGNDDGNGNGNDDGNDAHNGETIIEGNNDVVENDDDNKGRRGAFNVLATMRGANMANVEKRNAAIEKRAKEFKKSNHMIIPNVEARSVLISSGNLATPTEVSGITELFNGVSSIVDLVKVTDASGMGAYKVAYQTADATAAAQTEGAAYNTSDPTFGFVTITPTTEAVISYISKQVQKQTPLNYEAKVRESALTALRKQAAALITTQILASSLNTSVEIGEAIDEHTLRTIAFNYGGDENVVGGTVLFLNKSDLVDFGDIRGTNNKLPVYEITPDTSNPNTGIIKDGGLSVKYCINSNLTAGTMIYGQPQNCELALFSDYDIRVSEDYAFNLGLLAIRGDVEIGADVIKKDGFVVTSITSG